MTSYHEYNKVDKAKTLIAKLHQGQNIALITDAGTPAISDPGEVLVAMCMEEGIKVTSLPGPVACITALTLSGLPTRRFCFEGFLPSEKKERNLILEELSQESRTIIMYEAPHHLKKTLKELLDVIGDRRITLCRELTKRFEEIMPMSLTEAVSYYEQEDPRGEYVLVLEWKSLNDKKKEKQTDWQTVSIEEHMTMYEQNGMERKEAMKAVAKDRGISKREVYKYLLKDIDKEDS